MLYTQAFTLKRNHHALAPNFPAPTARQDFFLSALLEKSFWVLYCLTEIHPLPLSSVSFPLNLHMPFPVYHGESSSVQAFTSKCASGQQASKEPSR